MGILFPVFESKKILIFLNISFLMLFIMFLIVTITPPEPPEYLQQVIATKKIGCIDLDFHSLHNNEAKCAYLKSHAPCVTQSYVNYLQLFYCTFGRSAGWGYVILFIWLLMLFYLLGDTASTYFSAALESLSKFLNLSPAIAGVTLLSLGNGATDLFSSLVSFMGSGTGDVGLNTVLGGASFISCVVVGVICIALHSKEVSIDKTDFVRDVYSYIVVLVTLLAILIIGKINVWGSVAFASLYFVYVSVVYHSHTRRIKRLRLSDGSDLSVPFLSASDRAEVCGSLDDGDVVVVAVVFNSNSGKSDRSCFGASKSWSLLFLQMLELPLSLPRRLTIPLVSEDQWSKPYAVVSVTLAPILIAALCNRQFGDKSPDAPLVIYGFGFVIGFTLGVVAFVMTQKSIPPRQFLFPWLVGSFFMSMIWSYITAQELVGLLVSLGFIFKISSAIIGLTVLAWGNSLGDLVTNLTIALHDGPGGAQIAISGCYAGPIFNILVGLGFSFVGKSWRDFPSPIVMSSDDPYVMETLGLLVVGLTWALVMLPRRDMKPNRLLGVGLLGVYVVSISFRLVETLGFVHR